MIEVFAVLAATLCVTGQVTYVDREHSRSGIVKPDDGSRALWFAGENNSEIVAEMKGDADLKPGDRVVIRGENSDLGFAPGIIANEIELVDSGELPSAREVRLRDLDWGVMDNERVALEGVLVESRPDAKGCVRLSFATMDGPFIAVAPQAAADWPSLVDARLRLEGAAMSRFNIRGEFAGVMLQVVGPDAAKVLEYPNDPFARPLTPPDAILPYSPEGVDLHRRHVRGTVTYAKRGEFLWLEDGMATLKIYTDAKTVRRGDLVEAVGFATREHGLGALSAAEVRVVGHPGVPAAVHAGWVELENYPVDAHGKFLNFNGRRAQFDCRIVSAVKESGSLKLTLECEHTNLVSACVDEIGDLKVEESFGYHPNASVTGIMELETDDGRFDGQMPGIKAWNLRVATMDDIEIVHDAVWSANAARRMWQRVLLVVLAVALMALVGFAVYLVRLRADRHRQNILAAERKRMAADLHDTLEQSLAGARMVLNSAVTFTPGVPEPVKGAVSQANELLARAKSEMRARIFDMRSDVLFTQGPEKTLKAIATKIDAVGVVKVRTRLHALPGHLPEQVFSELVFIVQEAITNAIKHGRAKNIVIAADPGRLTIANDGEKFDPSAALGPEAGHYGLSGMRERARRAGLCLSFAAEGRWMKVVVAFTQ